MSHFSHFSVLFIMKVKLKQKLMKHLVEIQLITQVILTSQQNTTELFCAISFTSINYSIYRYCAGSNGVVGVVKKLVLLLEGDNYDNYNEKKKTQI